ncbi:protease complex subunit PrcB family protein [Flavobacterium sp. ALJ2]|uniref:protease complex subunit PrcB family protein n=1 Tax=Flavobacterium sp. ALJ2 TaxID=2786960 RepID=UPI0018A0153D|nr:protease complex subunit PrcB family protein [Flavobacterium sp. ALJ2]MBF7090371.1 protease complex subunit PrcB family protein [Flavobacterium sp. ALJ2]
MKKIILALFVALGISSCSLNADNDYQSCGDYSNVTFSGFPLECNYTIKDMPATPMAVAIKTQEKMDSFFIKNTNPCPTSVNPTIDFTKNYLIGIFSGPKPTSGYEIKISSIVENSCEIIVQYYEKEPLPNEEVNTPATNPYDFVLIPKTDKPIYLNKVSQSKNFVVIGSYSSQCTGSDCQLFFNINNLNVIQYFNVVVGQYDFSKYNYQTLNKKGDYSEFVKMIPTEILNLNGGTKTYGSPDSASQGGIYFELSQGNKVTKVLIDSNNTSDQSQEIITFKKAIKDKIAVLRN